MACKYYYKGHEFKSELELDDFLLEKLPFEPLLGDMVFSSRLGLLLTTALLNIIAANSEEVRKVAKEARRKNKEYDEDGEPIISKPPYIGVNKFLGEYRDSNRKPIIPEFRDESYWMRRFADWKLGDYTDDEKALFGISGEKGPALVNLKDLDNRRKLIENKWRNQAKAGDAIHNVLLLFFTTDSDGKYLFEMSDADFKLYCLDNLDADNKDFITEPVIELTIEYARKLHSDIKNKFGENCVFFPEFTITLKTNSILLDTLLGMIDLLIVDSDGKAHIIDYKTSLHNYDDFKSSKRISYEYLLAVYLRMLEKLGINVSGGRIMIAPIKIEGFHLDADDKWTYTGISSSKIVDDITDHISETHWSNIDDFLPVPFKVTVSTEDSILTITDTMNRCFPDFSDNRLDNEKATRDWLEKHDKLKRNDAGEFMFTKFEKNDPPIVSTDEVDFVKKVSEYFKKLLPKRIRETTKLRFKIKEAMEKGINMVDFPSAYGKDGTLTWLKDTISPYCNGNWEISEEASDLLENFGIIMLKTKDNVNVPSQIDFIRVSTRDLAYNYTKSINESNQYKTRKSLIGTFLTDILALSKLNNLMLEAAVGNVELYETMLVINLMTGLRDRTIGNILVVNPLRGYGLLASNEELFYCFNELARYAELPQNLFADGTIKLASKFELVKEKVAHIMATGASVEWKDTYKKYEFLQPVVDIIDSAVLGPGEIESKIKALTKCLDILTGANKTNEERNEVQRSLDIVLSSLTKLKEAHVDLYNTILLAIGELKGVNYRLLLDDHYLWFSDIMKVASEGFTGNYSDNPGNLKSETLNLVTKLVTEAYQNTRDEMQRKNVKIRSLVKALKSDARFGAILENTLGNLVSLYKNMYRETSDGDLLFKNVNELEGAEREFLTYMLEEINKDRFPNISESALAAMRDSNDPEYYRVPLCIGGTDSSISSQGLMSALKSKLSYFWPPKAWEIAKLKVEGVFTPSDDTDDRHERELIYKMGNMFLVGNDITTRLDKIALLKRDNIPLEMNFETLLLKHMFAYSVLRNMDDVFPLIKSAMIHILTLGAQLNKIFKNDTLYLREYIESKIFNLSIVEKGNKGWVKHANMIKLAASMFTLAMAPVLMFYQPLQGLWNDISLMIRKPDLKDSFTFKHFMAAFKLVFGDLAHFSDKPTLCSALNELYGINDMDMNTYVDRISTAKKGVWNMLNFLFKFASRPDFYNRMTIFTSLMMGDGCLEAHSIDSNGRLVYNWEKDARFAKFAAAVKAGNPNSTDPEVAKLRSLYYAMARLFVNEHAKDLDGNLFVLDMKDPKPLPRAYTNKLAESMKSLGDDIYGYYSHEKKSLIMSTAIGSLWLQFRTYWSGKKNLYLAHGGVKLRGSWEEYTETMTDPNTGEHREVKFYYLVNDNGVVLYDEPPLSEIEMDKRGLLKIAPVMLWKGLWLEGILLTLADIAKNAWNLKSIKGGWDSKFGDSVDPYLKRVYKCNMLQLAYDFIMFAVIGSILGALLGDWLDLLKKDNLKNRDFTKGLGVAAANIAVMSVKNSFLDFNFFSSIGDPFGLWTPFSIEWGSRTISNWYNVAMGDEDFWDGVVKTSSGLKLIKPALDTLKPDFWRTKREGGTFNVDK